MSAVGEGGAEGVLEAGRDVEDLAHGPLSPVDGEGSHDGVLDLLNGQLALRPVADVVDERGGVVPPGAVEAVVDDLQFPVVGPDFHTRGGQLVALLFARNVWLRGDVGDDEAAGEVAAGVGSGVEHLGDDGG